MTSFVNQKYESQSPESLLKILTHISEVLNQFETDMAKFDTSAQNKQADAGRAAARIAEQQLKKAQKNLKKVIQQEHEQSHHSFWGKVFKVAAVIGVVIGVVAFIAVGQPEIALAIGLAGGAAMGGLFQKGAEVMSKFLQSIGVPPQVANIVADATILALTVVLTMGYGEVAGLEVGAEMAAEEATEKAATEAAADSEGMLSRVQDLASELKDTVSDKLGSISRAIGPKVGLTMTTAGTALTNLNIAEDLLAALPLSEKEKKKLLPLMEVIQTLIAILTAVVGGGALSTAASTTAEAGEEANAFQKLQAFLSKNPGFLLSIQRWVNAGAGTGSGVVNLLNGISEPKIAQATKNIGEAHGEQILADRIQSMANQNVTKMGDTLSNDINIVTAELNVVDHLGDVMGKVAQATSA